jgi:hypothetical protein
MKSIPKIESERWLKPWQRKALVLLVAVVGVVATHALMLWLEKRKLARDAAKTSATIIDV